MGKTNKDQNKGEKRIHLKEKARRSKPFKGQVNLDVDSWRPTTMSDYEI
jgi:hypothetical protein